MHVLFVGNPGVGKSSLLNSLLGFHSFKSGVSIGSGLTSHLQSAEHDGHTYYDTPGIDDREKRQLAADEISNLLRKGGCFKLVFVCTLESGRARPTDIATMEAVLDAAEKVEAVTKGRFAVLVNKIEDGVMEKLRLEHNREILREYFSIGRELEHILFSPFIPQAAGKENYVMKDGAFVRNFVQDVPEMDLPRDSNFTVNIRDFDQMRDELTTKVEDLKKQLGDLRRHTVFNIVLDLCHTAVGGFAHGAGGAVANGSMAGRFTVRRLGLGAAQAAAAGANVGSST